MSFEQRWTMKEFGHWGKGFTDGWDTMLQAHVIDGRAGIASIKFQAFLHLGQEDYDHHLHRFLSSKKPGCNELNQIKEIDSESLLKYCGQDALLEWLVAKEQSKILGIRLKGMS
jgi:hypothetical protein